MGIESLNLNSNQESENSFEKQFAKREEIKVAGGTAEVVDVKPETLSDEVPVFLAPAWGCTIDIYKNAIEKLAEQNREVISLNHPRFGGDMSDAPEEMLEKYPYEEVRKALNIIGVLDGKNIVQTDAIAHSEGAVNLAIAAALYPEKFRSMVLYNPAGLIGEDTFTRLLQGFSKQDANKLDLDTLPVPEGISGEEADKYKKSRKEAQRKIENFNSEFLGYLKNPVRSFNEAKDTAKSQIHELLRYLHEEKGIKIAVMSGTEDPVFPVEKMQEITKTDMLDGFLSVRGGHGEIGDNPELYMTAAADLLVKLKAKSEKEQAEN
jgi:pimeloyl-ACP methyl ester carboxylesterase